MSGRGRKFPRVRTIFAILGTIWLIVTVWLMLRPAPDAIVGDWSSVSGDGRLIVWRYHNFRLLDGSGQVRTGRWEKLPMAAYERQFRYRQPNLPGLGAPWNEVERKGFYTQFDLDAAPDLQSSGGFTKLAVADGEVYQLGDSAPLVLVETSNGNLTLSGQGKMLWYRVFIPPVPWWKKPWEELRNWFQK